MANHHCWLNNLSSYEQLLIRLVSSWGTLIRSVYSSPQGFNSVHILSVSCQGRLSAEKPTTDPFLFPETNFRKVVETRICDTEALTTWTSAHLIVFYPMVLSSQGVCVKLDCAAPTSTARWLLRSSSTCRSTSTSASWALASSSSCSASSSAATCSDWDDGVHENSMDTMRLFWREPGRNWAFLVKCVQCVWRSSAAGTSSGFVHVPTLSTRSVC